jgi:uncharacterized membrane-anchored protein
MSSNRVFSTVGAIMLGLTATLVLRADDPPAPPSKDAAAAIASSLKWQTGSITVKDGLAKINLTDGFRFLDSANARKVLHDLWGNPDDPSVLGMIFPKDKGPIDHGSWAVTVSYEAEGYVKDDDAEKINYADLLKNMQQETTDSNPARVKEGYPAIQLVGWAAPPRYDKATHKLYWAKDLKFGDDNSDTLNYDIRVLGRRGVLVLGAIAPMNAFPEIDQKIPEILSMVEFQAGHTYAEFDPKVDKIAEYGLGALIAGGALAGAAKLGLFGLIAKYFVVVVLALKKFLIVAVVAIGALFKKIGAFFQKKSNLPPGAPRPP